MWCENKLMLVSNIYTPPKIKHTWLQRRSWMFILLQIGQWIIFIDSAMQWVTVLLHIHYLIMCACTKSQRWRLHQQSTRYPTPIENIISPSGSRPPDTLLIFTRTWLRYVRVFAVAIPSLCLSSVVCNVPAPYSAGWTFRQCFSTFYSLAIRWSPRKMLR